MKDRDKQAGIIKPDDLLKGEQRPIVSFESKAGGIQKARGLCKGRERVAVLQRPAECRPYQDGKKKGRGVTIGGR